MLVIHNSLGRTKQEFAPLRPGEVRMYVCGMTVYDYSHLGHARMLVVFDVVARYLRASGYRLTYVRNITDIDDKIIKRANENGESIQALTERFIRANEEDFAALGLLTPEHEPRATHSIPGMIRMIESLIARGHAYPAANGDVYYDVSSFQGYGRLSGKDPRARRGRRGEGRPARLRAVEGGQARRAVVGFAVGKGQARLAHRMLGHVLGAPRQPFRHPRRRRRPPIPAPRERDRAVGGRQRRALRELLDAQRLRPGRQGEDVQVARQLLHRARHPEEIRSGSGAFFHPARALPQPAQPLRREPRRREERAGASLHGPERHEDRGNDQAGLG